jgi:hypothetical protein
MFRDGMSEGPVEGHRIIGKGFVNICVFFDWRDGHEVIWDGGGWDYVPVKQPEPAPKPPSKPKLKAEPEDTPPKKKPSKRKPGRPKGSKNKPKK